MLLLLLHVVFRQRSKARRMVSVEMDGGQLSMILVSLARGLGVGMRVSRLERCEFILAAMKYRCINLSATNYYEIDCIKLS
jgi:hypothetical protein